MQEGNAHGGAGVRVLGQAAALAQELLPDVAQRAADHADARREGRLQARRRLQDAHGVAIEGALADRVGRHRPGRDPTR